MSHYGLIIAQPPAHFTHPRLQIRTAQDAHRVFEAVRQGILPLIRRRLSPSERDLLASGQVFVWEEAPTGSASGDDSSQTTSGLERWTDGRRWSQSRMREPFLFYEEKIQTTPEEKQAKADRRARKASSSDSQTLATLQPVRRQDRPTKPDGLTKQTYSSYVYLHPPSSSTPNGLSSSPSSSSSATDQPRKWHCVAYFSAVDWNNLPGVEAYPELRDIVVPDGIYVSTKGTGKTGAPPPLLNGPNDNIGGPPMLTLALPNPPSYPPPLPPSLTLPPVPPTTNTGSSRATGTNVVGFPMTTPTSTSSSSSTSMTSRWSPSSGSYHSPLTQYGSPMNNNNGSGHSGAASDGGVGPIRRPTSRGSYTSSSSPYSQPSHHFGTGNSYIKGRANSLSSSTSTASSSSLSVVRSGASASAGSNAMPGLAPLGRSTSYQGHRSQPPPALSNPHNQHHQHHHYSSSISSVSTGSPPTPGFMAPIPKPESFRQQRQSSGGHSHPSSSSQPQRDGEDVVMMDAQTVRTPTTEYPRRRDSGRERSGSRGGGGGGGGGDAYFSSPPPSSASSTATVTGGSYPGPSPSPTSPTPASSVPSTSSSAALPSLPSILGSQWTSSGPAGRSKEDSQALGAFRLAL